MTATALPVAPTIVTRPSWIDEASWERMSWAARMRATTRARRARPRMAPSIDALPMLTLVPAPPVTVAPIDPPAAPPVATFPCAMGCGRLTPLVYCDPCAAEHQVPEPVLPSAWLVAAWANRAEVDRHVVDGRGHVRHPRRGGSKHTPYRFRPVTS